MGLLLVDSILCSLSKTGDRGGLGLGVEFLDLERKSISNRGKIHLFTVYLVASSSRSSLLSLEVFVLLSAAEEGGEREE